MMLRGGRYEILGTIAAGGMAVVHLGRALGAGGFERLVAVKTMLPHLARQDEFVAMFLDEARLAARIRHPNVVATLDIQHDAEGLFLVMELVEGASLSRIQKTLLTARSARQRAEKGPATAPGQDAPDAGEQDGAPAMERLPLDVALRIFLDTLAGLHAAHELTGPDGEPQNLIHRDISPHNILVGADGIARITDFGVARAESRLGSTKTGSVKGKVTYMAPEQVRSDPLDRRADIYAAGVVLWELLTGQRSLRAENDLAAMRMIVEGDRQPPHEAEPAVPLPLSQACLRALARDRDERYPTAAAFAEAVESAAAECGVAIAGPRAVGQLLRTLGVHKLPVSPLPQDAAGSGGSSRDVRQSLQQSLSRAGSAAVPAASLPDLSGSLSPASRRAGSAADLSGASIDAGGATGDPDGPGASDAVTRADATPASIGTHAAFASHAIEAQPLRRSRRGLFVVIGAAAILTAAVAFFLANGPSAPPDTPSLAVPAELSGRGPEVTPVGSEAGSAASAAPSAVTVEPAPATASAAVPGKGPVHAPAASASTSPPASTPTRTAAPRPTATASAGPKSFRPKEL